MTKLSDEVLERMADAYWSFNGRKASRAATQAAWDASPAGELEICVRNMLDAINNGGIDSQEQGEPEVGIPIHKWHEEWAHYARAALSNLGAPHV